MAVLTNRRAWAVALVLALGCAVPARAESAGTREYALKAAFLYNFLRFVEWPDGRMPAPVVCMVGEDGTTSVVERALAGRQVGGREVGVKGLGTSTTAGGCSLVFVPDASLPAWPQLRERLGCQPVVTVGESPAFLESGGAISIFVESNRLRFDVNRGASVCAGLRFSSKLLSLARAVDGRQAER